MKKLIKKHLSQSTIDFLKSCERFMPSAFRKLMLPYALFIKTPFMLLKNKSNKSRKLEIGPGVHRIEGFETLNVIWAPHVDYIANASKLLPFSSSSFELIYGSHVFEHMPWYKLEVILKDWVRVLESGGSLELWVPNGFKITEAFIAAERDEPNNISLDGWYKYNPEKDPCVWLNGRIFSYGDGSGSKNDPNWHFSLFSPRYLMSLFDRVGLIDVHIMDSNEVRGYDHGWINLGIRGTKR